MAPPAHVPAGLTWLIGLVPLPVSVAIALPLCVGWHGAGMVGLLWGLVPAVFTGVLPHLMDRWVKRHRPEAEPGSGKPLILVVGSATSLICGLIIIVAYAAPRPVIACAAGLFAILVAVAIASQWRSPTGERVGWNVSVHAATSAGAAAICWVEFGVAAGLLAGVLASVVAWSRVLVHFLTGGQDGHTGVEAITGALVGAVVCGLIYLLLR